MQLWLSIQRQMYLNANTIVLAYNLFCQSALIQGFVIPFKKMRIKPTISPGLAYNMDNTYKLLHECFAPALSGIELLPQYEDTTQYDRLIYEQIDHAFGEFELLLSRQHIKLDFESVDRKYIFDHSIKQAIDQAHFTHFTQDFLTDLPHPFVFYQQLHAAWLTQGFNSNNFKLRPQKPLRLVPKQFSLFHSTEQIKKRLCQ